MVNQNQFLIGRNKISEHTYKKKTFRLITTFFLNWLKIMILWIFFCLVSEETVSLTNRDAGVQSMTEHVTGCRFEDQNRGNEIYILIYISISSFWCQGKARR